MTHSGGVPLKLEIPVKKALFQSDVLVPRPSRDVSDEAVVGPRERQFFKIEYSDEDQVDRHGFD